MTPTRPTLRRALSGSSLVAIAVFVALAVLPAQTPPASRPTAFVNVTALPMTSPTPQPNWTVIITNDRIVQAGPAAAVTTPAGATVIDGQGRFLLPGLTEMHGHIPPPNAPASLIESVLFLYVANGVTTVRGMQGADGQLALRDRAARGEIVAPTLYLAGPPFNGGTAGTPAAAAARVKAQKQEGWDLLKVLGGMNVESYDAMARAAKDVGIPFAGHVPAGVGVDRALRAGQTTIDHLDRFAEELGAQGPITDASIRAFAAKVAASSTAVVPTLFVWETLSGAPTLESRTGLPELRYLPREQIDQWTRSLTNRLRNPSFNAAAAAEYIQTRERLMKALAEARATILLGSDAPQQFNVPGFSIHHEVAAMAKAGMTPYEILRSGTAATGNHLRDHDRFGTIAAGQRADLILLTANPLTDLANLTKRAGVMVRGRWLPESDIQARLAEIARAYAR